MAGVTVIDEEWVYEDGARLASPPGVSLQSLLKLAWYCDSRGFVETRGIPYDWERWGDFA